jgi:hypothetical protein
MKNLIVVLTLCLASAAFAQTKKHVPEKSQGHISAELYRRKTERYNCHCRRAKTQPVRTEKKQNS